MREPRQSLTALENADEFVSRHIGPTDDDVRQMLNALQLTSLDALVAQTVPAAIRQQGELKLSGPFTEAQVGERARTLAGQNATYTSLIGMGYYNALTPAVIRRNLLENPGWYTAYTPYQAEVSQGRMQALLNYQQVIMDMTAMPLANASLLDEATAAAEGMAMAKRVTKSKARRIFVDVGCHPQTIAVVQTRARNMDIDVVVADPASDYLTSDDADSYFAVLLQYPNSHGEVASPQDIVTQAHEHKALVIVATDLMALALLTPPGEFGVDIVVGSAQRFGVPLGFGGPHAAFFATRDAYKRSMPGRIIGVSTDSQGNTALRMALQTREQHIRREKATSNICTAQVLLAVIAGFYAVYHGPQGIRRIAQRIHRLTCVLAAGLRAGGVDVTNSTAFDTLKIKLADTNAADALMRKAQDAQINLRRINADHVGLSLDETSNTALLEVLLQIFAVTGNADTIKQLDETAIDLLPPALQRQSDFLVHEVFHRYRSETELMRYLRRLQGQDIALDRSMIPLGSCTMKLNAATEMETIGLPGFSALHPFVPDSQAQGYHALFKELQQDLCEITGYDAISLQPNAGSQGEYAGLLCIQSYHSARGDLQRDVCLIPASAHGTNPASAVMAGLTVVIVACDDEGNVDVDDLTAKARQHADRLSALMVTYPSTHGVFEASIKQICSIVHEHGGQVYMDGANLNAMVGVCRPGDFGSDVSHLNLHKTFCIPHGGGGPGMGPIGVKSHLAPYLPGHSVVAGVNPHADSADTNEPSVISAAPWGSASILPISWAYIKMMGPGGLSKATHVAILNANYVAHRLQDSYPIVYTGNAGRVAHECIIDLSQIHDGCGISVEDVAKRLVDYGFHSPTMSWPVAESLMIEPTESESKAELDRFCDALIQIREEIAEVEQGRVPVDNNVLVNAPHTQGQLVAEEWDMPYSRQRAFFPAPWSMHDKYWPPVGRVDNVKGDRNLVCSCPPLDAYLDDVA